MFGLFATDFVSGLKRFLEGSLVRGAGCLIAGLVEAVAEDACFLKAACCCKRLEFILKWRSSCYQEIYLRNEAHHIVKKGRIFSLRHKSEFINSMIRMWSFRVGLHN